MPRPKHTTYNRPTYPPEYRRRLLELVKAGRKPAELSKEFGVHAATIRNWMRQAKIDAGGGGEGALTTDERSELARLRRQVAQLEEERDILKKFAAWSAQESNWNPRKRSGS
jgi:transposase